MFGNRDYFSSKMCWQVDHFGYRVIVTIYSVFSVFNRLFEGYKRIRNNWGFCLYFFVRDQFRSHKFPVFGRNPAKYRVEYMRDCLMVSMLFSGTFCAFYYLVFRNFQYLLLFYVCLSDWGDFGGWVRRRDHGQT